MFSAARPSTMLPVPLLHTPRLQLRPFAQEDVAAVFATFADDRVTRFYGIATFTQLQQARDLLERRLAEYQCSSAQALRWAITLAGQPQQAIGSCGYFAADAARAEVFIGYELRPDWWGQGLAREALQALCAHLFSADMPFAVHTVRATTDLQAERSAGLLRRLGFREQAALRDFKVSDTECRAVRAFALTREQWMPGEAAR